MLLKTQRFPFVFSDDLFVVRPAVAFATASDDARNGSTVMLAAVRITPQLAVAPFADLHNQQHSKPHNLTLHNVRSCYVNKYNGEAQFCQISSRRQV